MNNDFFKLYPNVILIKGYNRSMLLDLFFGKYYLIPNSLTEVLNELSQTNNSLKDFLSEYNITEREIIDEYFDFILKNNLGLKCDQTLKDGLVPLDLNFEIPYLIENVILEINENSNWINNDLFKKLDSLLVKFLEIRFLDSNSFYSNIDFILEKLKNAYIEGTEIIVPYDGKIKSKLEQINNNIRLWKITVYNTNSTFKIKDNYFKLEFTNQTSISDKHCGNINPNYFTIDTQAYIRNSNYNNCLAYKLSINNEGDIKNCPSANISFGHIHETDVVELVSKNKLFKKTWEITKNKINICKDCEYRMICSDCRVFIDNANDIYSRPFKCTYNPYISKWQGDDNFKSLEEVGVSTSKKSKTINHELIAQINSKIWD